MEKPLHYWDEYVNGSRCLLEAMDAHGCNTLVFSSSATLYGNSETLPIPETPPVAPINPYGHTKASVEQMLAMEAASGRSIPFTITDRRPGDAAISVSDPSKAAERMGWRTNQGLNDICRDGWVSQQQNPQGYT